MFLLPRYAILFGLLAVFAMSASSGNVLTSVAVHDGVRIGLRWESESNGSVLIPTTVGQDIPYGDSRLEIVIPVDLLASDARNHELKVRQPGQRAQRVSSTKTLPDGSLTFEIPFGATGESQDGELEIVLLRDRRPFGLDEITVASVSYVAGGDHVNVVSINRYPELSWDGCPPPCFERPRGLREITGDQWREALEVVEVADDGVQRTILDFNARLSPERPVSMVYAVDASGSVLLERNGASSQRMLEHFATFPDAAYGSDKVRNLDRLAMLFFDSKIEGYYAGNASGLSSEIRFFSPDEVATSWPTFCAWAAGERAPLRLDHAWLLAAANTLEATGYSLPASEHPAALVCETGATTSEVLRLYRTRAHGQQVSRPTSTDVLPALGAAVSGLDLLRRDANRPRAIRDNQEAIVLISDGIDSPFMNGDTEFRDQRHRQLQELLNGKRLFFIDIHSERVLVKLVLDALRDQTPLQYAVSRSIDENIDDPEIALDLIYLLAFPDDAVVRARLVAQLETTPFEQLLREAPVLQYLLRSVISQRLSLHDAAVDAIRRLAPASAETIFRGRGYELEAFDVDDPSLWRLSGAFAHDRHAVRATLKPKQVRGHLDRLEKATIQQFHRLARETRGLAVSMLTCIETLEDGRELSGPACAFHKILEAVRGTLHVNYELAANRQIDRVEIRLTPRGREILAAKQMPNASLTWASER